MSVIEFPGNRKRGPRSSGSGEQVRAAPEASPRAETIDLAASKERITSYLEGINDFRNDVSDIVDLAMRKAPDDAGLKQMDATLEDIVTTLFGLVQDVTSATTAAELHEAAARGHAAAVALSLCYTSFVRAYGELASRTDADEKVVPIGAARTGEIMARLLAAQTRLHDKPQLFPERS